MGKKDSITKRYLSNNKRFADIYNAYLYDGKQIIKPEVLNEFDTTLVSDIKGVAIQRFRDILKEAIIMSDEGFSYLLLGIENQSQIDCIMPIRNGMYDLMGYLKQTENDVYTKTKRNLNQ